MSISFILFSIGLGGLEVILKGSYHPFACFWFILIHKISDLNHGGGWKWGREVGLAGVEWRDGEKMQTTVIEQQLKKCLKNKNKKT